MKRFIYLIALVAIVSLLYSCASIGNPSGGPRDEDPPRFVRGTPAPGSLNVTQRRAELVFNELVNVKDAFNKVVVSPTSDQTPRVSSQGHKVIIDFGDSLRTNTTYTVDFGNAIEDNNEGNVLRGFAYSFSTGESLDTLQISGMVLDARTLEPQQGMLVGVHQNPADTTFRKIAMPRVAKTDDEGRFTIRGLKEGSYYVYAIKDVNNDNRWDNPEEEIAFLGYSVTPTSERVMTTDTIFNLKNGEVDTVVERMRTRFLPNDVLLNSFNIGYKAKYMTTNERQDSTRIRLIFNDKQEAAPALKLVGEESVTDWYTLERNVRNDSLTYWITNPELVRRDTLNLAFSYPRTNRDQVVEMGTDTIRFVTNRPFVKKSKESNPKADSIAAAKNRMLTLNLTASNEQNIFVPVTFEVSEPVKSLNSSAFHLEIKKDTLWVPVKEAPNIRLTADSLSQRHFTIDRKWDYGEAYRLTIDTLAVTGIYGRVSAPLTREFSFKKLADYATLDFNITGLPPGANGFVEILNQSDNPVAKAVMTNGVVKFKDITPGTYFARFVEDSNGNGEWDTGNPDENVQPDAVWYYPKKLTLKANWSLTQDWDLNAMPLDKQKPAAIKKNKSDAEKRAQQNANKSKDKRKNSQTDEEEEDLPFDATQNPFDPNSRNRFSNKSVYR